MTFKFLANAAFAAIVLCSFSTLAFGQGSSSIKAPTSMSNDGSTIVWSINAPNEGGTVTITAPGDAVMRNEFRAGNPPVFSLFQRNGSLRADGEYTYEIVVKPVLSGDVREQLAQARIEGNSEAVYQSLLKRGLIPSPMITYGAFRVLNGLIYTAGTGDEPEPKRDTPQSKSDTQNTKTVRSGVTADSADGGSNYQTFVEDVAVQGSLCVGVDCTTSENFGADTIRIKENNTRIHFNDTSNTASFPNNNWRIVANDTTNGGANYLAFEDSTHGYQSFRVDANAGANALVVASNGNVGLGTATPVLDLHINTGDTPAFRLEQNTSFGFPGQTWDIAGNEANFFVRDVTHSSRLPFKIQPGAQGGSLSIGLNGSVGIGLNSNTAFPNMPLDVRNNGNQLLTLDTAGKMTTASSLEIESGGIIFPDGTSQTTAATGGGGGGGVGSALGATYAQHILGGSSNKIASFSTITPTYDYNSFGIGSNGATGFFTASYDIPYNLNLADQTATFVTYKIRYRDQDGTGTAARVYIELVGMDINTGGRASSVLLDSNTEPGTGMQTITVCKPFDGTNFGASIRGMYLNVTVIGTAAASADFQHMQIYKGLSCP